MFFDNWYDLWRVLVVGTLSYFALIIILRGFGKRTLSKMSAFDLVVTVALGSTLATVLLSSDVSATEGILAFLLLAGLQYIVSWLSVRYPRVEQFVKGQPTLLLYQGKYLQKNMKQVRITESEIYAALRNNGSASTDALAVVLETDGTLSVITCRDDTENTATIGTMNPEEQSSK